MSTPNTTKDTTAFTGTPTAVSAPAMAARLALYETEHKRTATRIANKKTTITALEKDLDSPQQQLSVAKHAPTLDEQLIKGLGKEIEEKRDEIHTQTRRHNMLTLDYERLISMKSEKMEVQLRAEIGEMMGEVRDGGESEGEGRVA